MSVARLEPLLVKINDTACLLCINRKRLKELIVEGELELIEVDENAPRISVESLTAFIERQRIL